MMYSYRFRFFADFLQHGYTRFAVIALHFYLDQLMRLQAIVDFLEYAFGQAVIADHDDRVEVVAERTKMADLFGAELRHVKASIIRKGWEFSR